jgi:ABC-type amino acid transport substrate-binding protein
MNPRRRRTARWGTASLLLAAALAAGQAHAQSAPLTVCMGEDSPPLSSMKKGQVVGLDVSLAQAVAQELGRELRVLPFETELEKDSNLSHEVNALLSAGLCDLASGFPLLRADLGKPARERVKTPDYAGAKRTRDRPFETLGTLIASQPYQGSALVMVQRAGIPLVRSQWSELRGLKLGAVAGTLEGSLVAMAQGGQLVGSMVSMAQDDDVWKALNEARIDAVLVPTTAWDAHRARHPDTRLQVGSWQRSLGVNMGWVALAGREDLIAAVNRVIQRSQASGELQRWAAAAGLSWLPPTAPAVVGGLDMASLMND